ncbi:CD209 antigen-like protein E isoform X2 [Esox lucius]|uniref:CD209 antigen-like protein E isoform X2 n=1 Tax=Esox lucius TaxID=8010 RepID=UPI0014771093|nr:CD209 antigen-like protein E isoform X2 [Esox lucius]
MYRLMGGMTNSKLKGPCCLRKFGLETAKMSGDIIYSNVKFHKHRKQDDMGKETKCEEDVTYSEVRTGGAVNVQRESKCGSGDPSTPVGSKVVTPERRSQRVVLVTLVCLCVVLLVLSITLGVLYAYNLIDRQAEKARSEDLFAQMKDNLTAQKDLLSSEIQNYIRNLTKVNKLLADTTANLCSSGWGFYSGSCYNFSEDKLTWEQSQYACIHEGGHLVIIESEQEQDFIRMKVGKNNDKNGYWIGMTDMKKEGVWVWMDNTPLNKSISYWDLNNGTSNSGRPEPNNWPPREDCAQIGRHCSVQISCWFDLGCTIPSKRICESRAAKQ